MKETEFIIEDRIEYYQTKLVYLNTKLEELYEIYDNQLQLKDVEIKDLTNRLNVHIVRQSHKDIHLLIWRTDHKIE